jgi:signal transduction histidine kinase
MVVQAETVPRTLDAGDFAGAGAALAAVEETGRDALTEMRRLLGVLRSDGDGAELAPQPGLPRVLALVERTRGSGLPVELRIEGREEAWAARGGRRLPPGVDLTGYRVVEDALQAAAAQGATSAELLIRYTPDELRIQVTDDREGGASDRLPGLRERVGLYGGQLSAGRLDEGGFRLRARLPVEVVS